jgi:hypothetical protein
MNLGVAFDCRPGVAVSVLLHPSLHSSTARHLFFRFSFSWRYSFSINAFSFFFSSLHVNVVSNDPLMEKK